MITLHSEQEKYWNTRGKYNVIYDEPRRWGKTTLLYFAAIDQASIPGRNTLFLTPTYRMAEYSFYDFTGIYRLRASPRLSILFPNGSFIKFSNNPEQVYGCNVLLADDVNRIKDYRVTSNIDTIWEAYCNDYLIDQNKQSKLLAQVFDGQRNRNQIT